MTYLEQAWREGRRVALYRLERASDLMDRARPPYGVAALNAADTFAAACYSQNMLSDLDLTGCKQSDRSDREAWDRLTAYEWAWQIGLAYEALRWNGAEVGR